ncbi:MAG: insulinase family protein [Reichenbachiella sp.]
MQFFKKIQFLILILLLIGVGAIAQERTPLIGDMPFDSTITTGTLENGLKYFIKKNDRPAKRVELRLVVNAGAVLEDDDQLGLAHFTEHMAFNGSKNFDKNELVDYLQSVGVKFGAHLNAYTSFDETVYILPLPSDDNEILEQGMTILEDWAGGLNFDQAELEKERGVVIEEWRLGQGAQMRMLQEYFPIILKDSKYAERLPIGTKETLETFDQATIKRFYKDWYRPDLMAVVAVGDIEVAEMEIMIKRHFAKLKNPVTPRERVEFDLPDNKEPLVAVSSDVEATNIMFNIMFKSDVVASVSLEQYRNSHIQGLFLAMINQRLSNLVQSATPPYLYATTNIGAPVSRTTNAFSGFVVPQPTDVEGGVKKLLEEIKRVELHGFTGQELKIAKLNTIEAYTSSYNERDKSESKGKADELIRHFLQKESVPGIEFEYEFVNEYLEGISLKEVNAVVSKLITEENQVMYMTGPKREGLVLPTTNEILAWFAEVQTTTPAALEEEKIDENLIKGEVESGAIISSSAYDANGIKALVLSNGAKVFLKKTDFKNDEILFSAYRNGGTSVASDEDFWSASFASNIISQSGIGDYSYIQLQQVLAGKSVGISPYIGELESGISGNCSPKDLETLLQLNYLYFHNVRRDEEAYQSIIQRNKAVLENVLSNPSYYFQDELAKIMSQNHLRGGGIPTVADLDKVNLDKALSFYTETFAHAGAYTYWFVGNYEEEMLLPMIEKYLAGGNEVATKSNWIDRGVRPPNGRIAENRFKGTEPKSSVIMNFQTEGKYKRADSYFLRCFSEVLDIRLVETLREEKSGVYGVGASAQGHIAPYNHYSMQIQFPCGPDNVEELVTAALDVVKDIQENGVSDENLNKIKEAQRRDMELNWKKNGYWLNVMKSYCKNDFDLAKLNELEGRISDLSAKDIQKVAKKYVDTEEYIKVVLYPEGFELK